MSTEHAQRFEDHHVDTWRRDGAVLIEGFFTADEVRDVRADFERVFGRTHGAATALDAKRNGELGRFNPAQFTDFVAVPLDCSPALNLIGVHPALIAFAKAALRTDDVHLYQCQVWAKFTGDADYDQPFHCDFVNHTLTVPSRDERLNAVTVLCYFSDVTDAHGAAHYLNRSDSDRFAGPEATLITDAQQQAAMQASMRDVARSTASPAGSVFPYSIDVFHRGTNMTAPLGHRYAVMACFKSASNASIGYHAWPFHHTKPWANVFDHATPEQLACFGVPRPGHAFWTPATIDGAQQRYPRWDLTPYRDALS